MPIITTPADFVPVALIHDTQVTATVLPLSTVAGSNFKTMSRIVVAVDPGDIIQIIGRSRVTNDAGYNTGVGYYMWMYDTDDGVPYAQKTWTKIGEMNGDNVNTQRHHMPLHLTDCYQVPPTWPAGHRIALIFRADAHSTAAVAGDNIDVDSGYGCISAIRWTSAAKAPAFMEQRALIDAQAAQLANVEAALASLSSRVDELEAPNPA